VLNDKNLVSHGLCQTVRENENIIGYSLLSSSSVLVYLLIPFSNAEVIAL
jgi:hypothetical protein